MSRIAAAALAALAGLTLTLPASAVEWKWRESSGRIVYSDRPPPASVPDKAILRSPRGLTSQPVPPSPTSPSLVPGPVAVIGAPAAASAAASAPAVKTAEPELEAKRRKEAEAKVAEQKASDAKVAAARAENCVRARGQLKSLDDGVRISRTNAKGEREVLDDKARAAEQVRMREIIKSDCK